MTLSRNRRLNIISGPELGFDEEVPVGVEGHLRAGMTESLRDLEDVAPGRDEQTRVGVPPFIGNPVDAERVTSRTPDASGPVLPVQRPAPIAWNEECGWCTVHGGVCDEACPDWLKKGHRPDGSGFGGLNTPWPVAASDQQGRLAHVTGPKPDELTGTQAAVGQQFYGKHVSWCDHPSPDRFDVRYRNRATLGRFLGHGLDGGADHGIRGDESLANRGSESGGQDPGCCVDGLCRCSPPDAIGTPSLYSRDAQITEADPTKGWFYPPINHPRPLPESAHLPTGAVGADPRSEELAQRQSRRFWGSMSAEFKAADDRTLELLSLGFGGEPTRPLSSLLPPGHAPRGLLGIFVNGGH